MRNILKKIKRLIKFAAVIGTDDSGPYPIIKNTYMGRLASRAINLTPFGLWGHPPPGSLALVLNGNGVESNQACIANDYVNRPVKNLAEGEVVIGNKESHIYFKANGDIVINLKAGANLTNNGEVVINGDVNINGELEADDLTGAGVHYGKHVHPLPGGNTVGQPQN